LLGVLDGFNSSEEYSRTLLGSKSFEKIKILVASYSSRVLKNSLESKISEKYKI
jgi:hypothetical protein